jgi:HEAT repeat protein
MKKVLLFCLAALSAGCGKSTADWVAQLRSGDVTLRRQAIRALAEKRAESETIVPALAGALEDEDAYVRRDAARALAKIGPEAKPALAALVKLLQDQVPRVRGAAAEALKKVDPASAARAGVQ